MNRRGLRAQQACLATVQAGVLAAGMLIFPGCGKPSSPGTTPVSQATPQQQRQSAILLQKGSQLLSDNLLSEAEAALQEAHRLDPTSIPAAMALARACRLQSRYSASRKLLEEILLAPSAGESDRTRARELLVEVLLESGDAQAAKEACRPLLEGRGGPSAVARRLAGMVAYRTGDLPTALEHLKEAARLAPADPETRTDLGLVLLQAGEVEAAARELEEAARLDPGSQTAVSNLAKAYQRLGRGEDAARALERYRTIYDVKSVRQKLGPLRKRGVDAYNAGRLDVALESFQEVLRLSPRDPQALAQAGSVLLAMQRLDEAQASLEQSLKIRQDDDFALTELARVHALKNDLPAAIDLLQKAVAVNPAAPEPHYFLAGIYMAQGRQEEFRKEKEAFLRLGGGSAADSLRPLPGGGTP